MALGDVDQEEMSLGLEEVDLSVLVAGLECEGPEGEQHAAHLNLGVPQQGERCCTYSVSNSQ